MESSLKGVVRKEETRRNAIKRYKNAKDTLEERNLKKLTEATTWYKNIDNETQESENALERRKEKEGSWTGWRKVNRKRKKNKGEIEIEGKTKLMSVLFVQHTPRSELAKRIRDKLESLEKLGTLKFKVVEKTGSKLEEILHKSDAWNDRDCGRQDCLLCSSASEDDKKGVCKRRNVVYETYCITCYEREKGKKDERELYNQISDKKEEKVTSAEIVERK